MSEKSRQIQCTLYFDRSRRIINVLRPLMDFTYNPSRAQWALKSPFTCLERQNNGDTGPPARYQRHTALMN